MNLIHSKRMGALLALVLAASGCGGSSDSTSTTVTVPGTIAGTVKKGTAVVGGITVTPSPAVSPAVVTGSDGKYTIDLPPGTYTLAFNGDGVEPASSDSLTVTASHTTTWEQTLAVSKLVVSVNLPESAAEGEPVGFGKKVSGITVTAKLDGNPVTPESVTWSIRSYDGLRDPPAAATPDPATGTTTSFDVGTFAALRQGGNAWMSAKYGTAFEYIPLPSREQLVPFSAQQVLAMSYMVRATVKVGAHTTTGSAVVSPVSVSNGGNYQPKGLLIVGNAASDTGNAWSLQYLSATATSPTFAPAPADLLQDAGGRNPYFLPTATGVYKLQNGDAGTPIYVRVSTYHGVGKKADDPGDDGKSCIGCHSGNYALTQFDEWIGSAHANHNYDDPFATSMPLVQYELTDTSPGNHYNESCLECHTVGFNKAPTADNNGFDDVARAAGWTFPATKGPDAWASVVAVPGMLHRASIQCENCHGPLEPSEHSQPEQAGFGGLFGLPLSPVASMSASVCTTCHDEQPYHDRGSLWAFSKHADTQLAIDDSTVENRPSSFSASSSSVSGVAHCGRCHAAEGFTLYLPQQQGWAGSCADEMSLTADASSATGRANYIRPRVVNDDGSLGACFSITSDTATLAPADAYFRKMGLTKAGVHSQTCQVCHDPHKTELRVTGDTQVTAASFNYKNAGAGALCIICHNSRIGNPVYADSAKSSYSAPHAASQGDIFAGRNAYFYGQATSGATLDVLDYKSAHSFMANACADCHVKWVPDDIQKQFGIHTDNHTFESSLKVCAECHAEGIGEKVQAQVEEKLDALALKLRTLYAAKLNKDGATDAMDRYVVQDGAVTDTKLDPAAVTPGTVAKVDLTEFHGQPGLILTLTDGTAFGNNIGSFKSGGTAIFAGGALSGVPAKAFYNYLLVHGGAAKGVHNPSFVNGVLDATLAQINAVKALP